MSWPSPGQRRSGSWRPPQASRPALRDSQVAHSLRDGWAPGTRGKVEDCVSWQSGEEGLGDSCFTRGASASATCVGEGAIPGEPPED